MKFRERLTIQNQQMRPGHKTYRAPMFDMDGQPIEKECFFGELVNRLGRYEDLGTIEELERLKKSSDKMITAQNLTNTVE